jgi:CRP-like cAMP-binding protein
MSAMVDVLRQVPYFAELEAGSLRSLAGQVRGRKYKAGEVILVAKAVIRLLATRLRALTLMIEDLSLRGVVARVAKLLLDCSRGHQTLVEDAGGACARLTQHQIAAMTGSVREVVQRALKALERDGAIRLERARVVVLDVKALELWSESTGSLAA